MKLVSFNVNGLRARLHQLERLIQSHTPDIIGLQETKVQDEEFPRARVEALGYQVCFHGQKGHYGVAILSKERPVEVGTGFPNSDGDEQRRLIWARFEGSSGQPLTVINGYFPQGESRDHPTKFPNKQRFYADLLDYLHSRHDPAGQLVVMGDMNVAPTDKDIGIGADNAKRWLRSGKCSFLPEEREWLEALLAWGLVDSFRALQSEADDRFSWFDYRSKGFEREPRSGLRIDLILATRSLMARCQGVGIDYDIRAMEKPSDHCPVWVEFGG